MPWLNHTTFATEGWRAMRSGTREAGQAIGGETGEAFGEEASNCQITDLGRLAL